MKFTASAHDLHSALNHASSVSPSKSASLVAYTGVNLSVEGQTLTVSGSDGEVSVSVYVPVKEAADGSALLVPRQLIKWLSKAPRGADVVVSAKGAGKLEVSLHDSGSPYSFHTMVASFPSAGTGIKATETVDFSRLATALSCVKDVADEVATGSSQTAVQLVFTEGDMYINATDRLRLVRAELKGVGGPTLTAVVEVKALEMAKTLRSTKVGSDKSARTLVFEGEGHRITVRTLDVEFPPVDNILAVAPEYRATVSQSSLAASIDRLACVCDDGAPLLMEFDGHTLGLSAQSVSVGTGSEEVELTSPAPAPTTLAVNIDFMRQAVNTSPNTELALGWSSPTTPLFVTSSGVIDLTTVVMPIKLSD